MITKFDSSYYGTVDMENLGYAGTPINERRYSQAELGGALHKVVEYAKCMDERGYDTFWMAEHHFQPEGTELPESADDGDALVRGDEEPAHWLRLQRRADVAPAAPRGRLRDGRHPDWWPRDLRCRARLSHPRGRDVRRAAARPEGQPRIVRGRR